jgi:tetratricopeptide (TPR) repeat protein
MAAADTPAADPSPDDWQARCAALLAGAEAALAAAPEPARLQAALAACEQAAALARARLPDPDDAESRAAMAFGFLPGLAGLAKPGGEPAAREWLARAVALRERISKRAAPSADAGQASPDASGRGETRSPTPAPYSITISNLPTRAPSTPLNTGWAQGDDALWQEAMTQFATARTAYRRGDPRSLQEAIRAVDAGIAIARRVDLSSPERIRNLSIAYDTKGFALRDIGTAEAIAAAVQAHDAAIALLRRLDPDNPTHRTSLAGSHVNKGIALAASKRPGDLSAAMAEYDEAIRLLSPVCAEPNAEAQALSFLSNAHGNKGQTLQIIGTPAALADAVRAYDAAIKLRSRLDLDIPEYRDGLARAHNNKGYALEAIGTPAALADAVRAYDAAIELRSRLDLDIPEYRDGLARAHNNKGNALEAIGTPAALADAVRAYDAAIELRSRLDLDLPKYRNGLAGAHYNKGIALDAIGTPAALAEAIRAYDKAIALLSPMRLDIREYRNGLAGAYINRGNALRALGTPEGLERALVDYQTGIDLLPDALALAWHPAADFKANGYINLAIALAALGRPVDAEDAAEQGLALLQRLEAKGQYVLRAKREQLFRITLNYGHAANQHPILPELALEHLDPDVPGAAPASAAMHQAALEVLRRALAEVLTLPQGDALRVEYGRAFARLAEIRERWFGGTATAAALRAQDAELRGDADAARGMIAEYLQARPRDPEGWRVQAELCRRLGDGPGQEAALTELGRRLVHAGTTPPAAGAEPVARVGGALLQLRLARDLDALLPRVAAAELPDALEGLLATALGWQRWLIRDYPDAVLAPPDGESHLPAALLADWRENLNAPLDAAWQTAELEWQRLLPRLVNAHDAKTRADLLRDTLGAADRLLIEAIALVPQDWRGFVEGLIHAWRDIAAGSLGAGADADADADADATAREQRAADIAEALGRALSGITHRLDAAALADSMAALAHTLGAAWDALLTPTERRLLAAAHRLKQHPGMARYAGLELGLALETALRERCIEPLREQPAAVLSRLAADAPRLDPQQAALIGYLQGKRRPPALGVMVELYHRVLAHWDAPPPGLAAHLRALLQRWPQPEALRGADGAQQRRRRDGLYALLQVRNACAHAEVPPDDAAVEQAWQHAAGDPRDGFFPVLGRAHGLGPDA